MIPQEKCEAVTRGLREAFGVSKFEDISKLTGGHTSSLVFRIVVGGSPYVLKIITRTEDPTRHYTSMKAAAEAGVAPRVWYTSIEDRISITDFVEAKPLAISEALIKLPALLRTLHALPPFGRAPFNTTCTFLLNKGPALDGFLQKFRTDNILPKAESEEFFARYTEVAAVYPYDDGEMVSSHNDVFKPDNVLFDGQRVWLVDWEAAFLNDRYADLAVLANHVVTNDDEETVYLQEYFGATPDRYQRARFHLMQQLAHLFYSMVFLSLGSAGQPVDWSRAVPGFDDYHRRMWAREVDLADNDVRLTYGRVHWERVVQNVRQARYKEALRIVSQPEPTAKVIALRSL
ncbi:phosphotransferase [uncultured Paludibaculum sp.]|uniref:phosphotransferase n=1 Tax=uncultured Paludibaculum sp. TaxID=1765020 RepID=UPI002AAC3D33|nr:phosphotransferase [uncultured Paludibaculum sp.]